ncbi:MAG TPA: glycosyltransferase [Acidobacteriaceae bacterium]|jgi:GT2 family glycosyltransferase|nr:glycosyltransferase [Acidobacteriaceae bacterium]
MKIAVIICTINRPAILHQTVLSIRRQSLAPVQIILSSPGPEHVLPETLEIVGVEWVQAPAGSATQRNEGMRRVSAEAELIAFLDDDIQLTRAYFAEMARFFREYPHIVLASGRLLHDGGRGTRIDAEEARKLCDDWDRNCAPGAPLAFKTMDSGYGCNMVVRVAELHDCRFDENLPLYAWLEDRDFSHRCTKGKYPPVELANAVAVHLGWRSGRGPGVRLGFSTVVNPVYLRKKTRMFSLSYIVVHYWLRCLVGNILGILTRDQDYDRWGLLRGNMIGYWHLITGNCNPQYILRL